MIKRQVFRVDSVELTRIPSKPAQVNITAYGTASTPGWTAAQLVPFIYVQAPPDGIYDFDLVALPPIGGVTTQVLTPLPEPASLTEFLPDKFRGVKIHALDNKMQALLTPESGEVTLKGADTVPDLATHLKAVAGLFAKAKGTSPSKASDCRQACHDTYVRELEKCKDVSCITKATGRYVLCLQKC